MFLTLTFLQCVFYLTFLHCVKVKVKVWLFSIVRSGCRQLQLLSDHNVPSETTPPRISDSIFKKIHHRERVQPNLIKISLKIQFKVQIQCVPACMLYVRPLQRDGPWFVDSCPPRTTIQIEYVNKFYDTIRNGMGDPFYSQRGISEDCFSTSWGIILSHIKDNMPIMIH